MSFLKKNILYRIGLVGVFFFVFFLLQSQTVSATTCSGMCTNPSCLPGWVQDTAASPLDCPVTGDLCCISSSTTSGQCALLHGICCSTNCSGTSVGSCGATGNCYVGAGATGASASIPFTNPISGANNSTVEGVVGSISVALQGIIVVLALVFIVIGAVIYVTSAGNDERMKTAKAAITASMIGLALAIAAPSFLKQIASVLGWNTTEASLTGAKTLTALALSVLQFLLSIIGILGIIMLVIGGLAYLTSAGDEERSQSGKKIITYAIIGISVALASLILVTQVANLFVV